MPITLYRASPAFALLAAALAQAAPAAAQAPDCGGLGAAGQWIGGTVELSDPARAGDTMILPARTVPLGGEAVALFTLAREQAVRIEARAATPGGDPVVEVYDAAGNLVVTDDDSGGGFDARVEIDLAPGAYCVAVRGFGGAGFSTDIGVGQLDHGALTEGLRGGFFDPDGSFGGPEFVGIQPCLPDTEAADLVSGSLDAALGSGGAQATDTVTGTPYYRFSLDTAQALSIRALNQNADPYIYLFDATGDLIAENDDFDGLNARIDITGTLPPGDYCVGVRALSDPDLPVTLVVLPYDAAAEQNEQIAAGEAAPPLDGTWPIRSLGLLSAVIERDLTVSGTRAEWVSFELDVPTVLRIDAREVRDSDPLIILFDRAGNEVAFNDDANGTLDSQLLLQLDPGLYLLAVRQYSDASTGTIRLTLQRFVAATK